jgi:hypothetical protein
VIAARLGVSGEMLRLVAKRFVESGGDVLATVSRKKRDFPPVPSPVTGEVEARLIALACSQPPAGYARWSLRLLEKQVELTDDIPDLDHSNIGRVLKNGTASSSELDSVGDLGSAAWHLISSMINLVQGRCSYRGACCPSVPVPLSKSRSEHLAQLAGGIVLNASGRLSAGGAVALFAIARPASAHRSLDFLLIVQEWSVMSSTRRGADHPPKPPYSRDGVAGFCSGPRKICANVSAISVGVSWPVRVKPETVQLSMPSIAMRTSRAMTASSSSCRSISVLVLT